MHNLFFVYFVNLYMFRAYLGSKRIEVEEMFLRIIFASIWFFFVRQNRVSALEGNVQCWSQCSTDRNM